MVTICLQCGDEGFTNAFVYCVKCLEFAVHRYCLEEMPETFDEFVYWVCDHCVVESGRNFTTVKLKTNGSGIRDPTILKEFEAQGAERERRALFSRKKPLSSLKTKCSDFSEAVKLHVNSPLPMLNKEYSDLRTKVGNDGLHPDETNVELEPTRSNRVEETPVGEKWSPKRKEAIYSIANSPEGGITKSLDVCQQAPVHIEYSPPSTPVDLAKPRVDPIWRGGFIIVNKNSAVFDGLAAHLSTKVCLKVYETARLFPAFLKLGLYPKADVWPKSFRKSQPSGDSIALYFLALDNRSAKPYDHLVKDMMHRELALRATVEDAELLVFTSNELPRDYWEFKGKYYLWGVFKAKQVLPS